jgi:hypothetical protein
LDTTKGSLIGSQRVPTARNTCHQSLHRPQLDDTAGAQAVRRLAAADPVESTHVQWPTPFGWHRIQEATVFIPDGTLRSGGYRGDGYRSDGYRRDGYRSFRYIAPAVLTFGAPGTAAA